MNSPALSGELSRISIAARKAARSNEWTVVSRCAARIRKQCERHPEGWFLTGLVDKAAGRRSQAAAAFRKALELDRARYDAAVELAFQYWHLQRHREANDLLIQYESRLSNSPLYLDMAATLYSRLGLHARAWPLYSRATELQPEINRFRESLAACAVRLGKIQEAKEIYRSLLERYPNHQQNHFELSRLERAKDFSHVDQMKRVLETTQLPAEKNIFLYYALGKELEDLECWDEAFNYYKLGGDAAASQARKAGYRVKSQTDLVDTVIEICDANWLADGAGQRSPSHSPKAPIFIVGLPRTGTTLTERIIASHSQVDTADETLFVPLAIKRLSGVLSQEAMTPEMIKSASRIDCRLIAEAYLNSIEYRLGNKPRFIDKLPDNILYLGFIAKAFPDAHIVHLRRNPMDACFAMYKQSFFSFAYTLDDLATYYLAYDRLRRHWSEVLKDRIIEISYESLVTDPEAQTRALLQRLGLEFEQACLDFHLNRMPSATASAAQIREKAHTRSVNKWRHWQTQLQPLRERLEASGVEIS